MSKIKINTKTLTALAMIAAIAFVLAALVRVPLVSLGNLTLRYDPKDIVMTIGGFIYGPLAAAGVSVVVSLIQMVTVSSTGPWGAFMNIVGSIAFCCTASFIYRRSRSITSAIIGLTAGAIVSTIAMIGWNYIILPMYMGWPREAVLPMIIPLFLPFNLISNGLNAALTLILYKYVKRALGKAKLLPPTQETSHATTKLWVTISAIFVILTCVLWVLVLR